MNLSPGTSIRLKTKGDTILIESLAKNDEKKGNYAGENVGDAWSAKIQAAKATSTQTQKVGGALLLCKTNTNLISLISQPLPQDNKQGVEDEDEWK